MEGGTTERGEEGGAFGEGGVESGRGVIPAAGCPGGKAAAGCRSPRGGAGEGGVESGRGVILVAGSWVCFSGLPEKQISGIGGFDEDDAGHSE
jgi:hypothetical protein